MSTTRGIFETFQNPAPQAATPPPSPFAIAADSPQSPPQNLAPSPFAVAPPAEQARRESPFAIVSEEEVSAYEDSKTVRLPERRKAPESPFQISEPQGFGFEAPQQAQPQALKASPFEVERPAPAPQQTPPASPFTMEHAPAAAAPPAPAPPSQNAFGGWPQSESAPRPAPTPVAPHPAPAPQPAAFAPPQQHAAAASSDSDSSHSDSYTIKQLELRAIFGVDREMTHEEIVQRARSLPGIRQIARVSESDISAVDALKTVIQNLGFGSSPIKLYSGSVPIEFIREGKTLLAVQTDGGFAPGVRETLMIVARELGR